MANTLRVAAARKRAITSGLGITASVTMQEDPLQRTLVAATGELVNDDEAPRNNSVRVSPLGNVDLCLARASSVDRGSQTRTPRERTKRAV